MTVGVLDAVTTAEYPYIYAGDDPINFTDPSGACVLCTKHIKRAAKKVGCAVKKHPGWAVAAVAFGVAGVATAGLGVAVLGGGLAEGSFAGLGSLAGTEAIHVGGTFVLAGELGIAGSAASGYAASKGC